MPTSKEALNKRVYRATLSKPERDAHARNAAQNARHAAARAKVAELARADRRRYLILLAGVRVAAGIEAAADDTNGA